MTSSTTLIPYLLVAAYGLKLALTGETYLADLRERLRDACRGAVATVYSMGMIYAGGAVRLAVRCALRAGEPSVHSCAAREPKTLQAEGRIFSAIIAMAL
jgi:arginine:ornithine antiporter / lysine permease